MHVPNATKLRWQQCSGSRSGDGTGSYVCWTSWIRIRIRNLFKDPAPDPSINKQINEEKPWFLLFCDFFMTFYIWRMMLMCLQKGISIKTYEKKYFVAVLNVNDEKSKIRNPSPLVEDLRIRIRIRIRTKMSRIRNTGWQLTSCILYMHRCS